MFLSRSFKLCSHLLRSSFSTVNQQCALISKCRYHIFTRANVTSQSNRRQFYNWFRKPSETELKQQDKISPDYRLIYNNTIDSYLVIGQIAAAINAGFLAVMIFRSTTLKTDIFFDKMNETPVQGDNSELVIYTTALVVCIFVIQRMIARIPIRIYKSPTKQYVFVNRGIVPLSKKYFTCIANQLVKVEDVSPIVPWKDSTYKVVEDTQERVVLLMDYYFKKPADMNILLGYQKEREE